MAALTVIITGDATKLQAEMTKIEQMAKRTGQKIKTSLDTGGGEGGALGMKSGAIRELLTLIREIGRGNWSRVPGSFSIMLQRMGSLKFLLNPVTGIVAGLVAGVFAAYKLTTHLVDKLTGLKLPDFHPEYLGKEFTITGRIAEARREVNRAYQESVDLANSAARAAEREAQMTKQAFDHARKMNESAKETELAKAKTAKQREEVLRKYSDMELALSRQERQADEERLKQKAAGEAKEGSGYLTQHDKIIAAVGTKEADAQKTRLAKGKADAAQKFLDELHTAGKTGKALDAVYKAYNAVAFTGVSGKDLDAAKKNAVKEASDYIQAYYHRVDEEQGNDVKRQDAEKLKEKAVARAASIAQDQQALADQKRLHAQQNKDEQEEADAKMKAELAQSTRIKAVHGQLNNFQQVGAYAGGVELINVNRRMERHLAKIAQHLGAGRGITGGMGRVFYGR